MDPTRLDFRSRLQALRRLGVFVQVRHLGVTLMNGSQLVELFLRRGRKHVLALTADFVDDDCSNDRLFRRFAS